MADNFAPTKARSSASVQSTTQSYAATASSLRELTRAFTTQLMGLQSLVTALKLAAQADDGGGDAVLYWPDLMETLLEKIPSHEHVQSSLDAIEGELVLMNTAAKAAAGRSRLDLGSSAKVTA